MKKRSTRGGVKGALVWDLERAMKRAGIGRKQLAQLSGASRAQVERVLDPEDESVRLLTLAKVARVVRPRLRLGLGRGRGS
jgi:antitoxin HicB